MTSMETETMTTRWIAMLMLVAGLTVPTGSRADEPEVAKDKIETSTVEFRGGAGTIKGFLAKPKGDGPFPAIVVIHEWWGLSDWVKRNAQVLASQGYAALAVDLYGGRLTADPGEAHELMRALDHKEAVADLKGGVAYLQSKEFTAKGKLGAIGWCMGGGLARELAQVSDAVGPTVICYGAVTVDGEQLDQLKGKPVLGIFAADDRGIPVARVKQFAEGLEDRGSKVKLNIYEGAGHGFMRPGGMGHNAEAAEKAWKEIGEFFAAQLPKT